MQEEHPSLLFAGFEGRYTNKAGKTAEGSATFFRKDRYRAVALKEMKMNELFANILADPSAHAIHSQFLPLLQSNPTLVQALSRVRLQPCVLFGRGARPSACTPFLCMMEPGPALHNGLCTACPCNASDDLTSNGCLYGATSVPVATKCPCVSSLTCGLHCRIG